MFLEVLSKRVYFAKHHAGLGSHHPVRSAQSLTLLARRNNSCLKIGLSDSNVSHVLPVNQSFFARLKIFCCQLISACNVVSIHTLFITIAYASARVTSRSGSKVFLSAEIIPYLRAVSTTGCIQNASPFPISS